MRMPPLLSKGGVIGISAPSHIALPERYADTIRSIERMGFRVKLAENFYSNAYGYSASERERAEDLNALFLDDEVEMVFFGGGEGAVELLPHIDFAAIAAHPKIVSSYSDGTTLLNAISSQAGFVTFYGQTPSDFADLRQYTYEQFSAHFLEGQPEYLRPNTLWRTANPGTCAGRLIGGYVGSFALLLGSKYFGYDPAEKHLLFLEDHEMFNSIGALSAQLAWIEQSDFMRSVAGVLFGHYSSPVNEYLIERLGRLGRHFGIPVAYCDDFGHGVNHAILPIGAHGRMDADAHTLAFSYVEDDE